MESKAGRGREWWWYGGILVGVAEKGTKEGQELDFLYLPAVIR